MPTHAVIMAGGIGSRFWPASRQARPKQFLNVFGDATLIQNTAARLQGLAPPERQFVVTNARYTEQTTRQLPAVPAENVLAEPVGRNTAPCIAYAATVLHARDPEAMMIVLPADHVIRDVRRFHDTLGAAVEQAQEPGALVTLGIEPTHPATGYGYIQYESEDAPETEPAAHPVRTFAEKPDLPTAERFLDSGDFLWNSGMFVWRADSILAKMREHLPAVHEAFAPVGEAVEAGEPPTDETVRAAYQACPSISIDYGVMERAEDVYVVPGRFDWSDVGDWQAVYDMREKDEHGNALAGDTLVHDASRCLVEADADSERFVALVGVHDLAVVDTEDAVLVCHRDSTQQVRNVVEYLHAHQLEEYV